MNQVHQLESSKERLSRQPIRVQNEKSPGRQKLLSKRLSWMIKSDVSKRNEVSSTAPMQTTSEKLSTKSNRKHLRRFSSLYKIQNKKINRHPKEKRLEKKKQTGNREIEIAIFREKPDVPVVYKIFVGLHFFHTFNSVFNRNLSINSIAVTSLGININITLPSRSTFCIGQLLGLIICYVGENFITMKNAFLIGTIIGLFNPLVNLIAYSYLIDCSKHQSFVYVLIFSAAILRGMDLIRLASILAQLKHPDQGVYSRRYVFWIVYAFEIGYAVALYCFTVATDYFVICIIGFFCYIFDILIVYFLLEILIFDEFHSRIVDKHIASLLRSVKTQDNSSRLSKKRSHKKKKKTGSAETRHLIGMLLVLLPFLAHGIMYNFLIYITFPAHDSLVRRTGFVNPENIITTFVIYKAAVVIVMPFNEFILRPLVKHVGIKTRLQCLGFGYALLGLTVLFSFLVSYLIALSMPIIPSSDTTQLRFYNILPTTTVLYPDIFKQEAVLPGYGRFEFLNLYCYDGKRVVNLRVTNKEFNINRTYEIVGKANESHSYTIAENGLKLTEDPDPIDEGKATTNLARCFVITSIYDLSGQIDVENEQEEVFSVVFPALKDSSVFNVLEGRYTIGFYRNDEHSVLNKASFESGLYVIIVHGNHSQLNGTIFNLLRNPSSKVFFLLPEIFLLALAESYTKVSFYYFIVTESPKGIGCTVLTLGNLIMYNGLGLNIWHPFKKEDLMVPASICLTLCSVSFTFFVYAAMKYSYWNSY